MILTPCECIDIHMLRMHDCINVCVMMVGVAYTGLQQALYMTLYI